MSRKSALAHVLLGAALLSTAAFAKDAPMNDDSKAFLKAAAQSGAGEIAHAKIALQMASNPDIQAFAKDMIADHEAVSEKVKALAKEDKVTLPAGLTAKQKADAKRLQKLNDMNRSFDREYLELTVQEHEKAIKRFEKQAKSGTDAEVRALAEETLPKLKAHLDHAATLSTRLNLKSNE